MLKFLVPLLLLSGSAYAQDIEALTSPNKPDTVTIDRPYPPSNVLPAPKVVALPTGKCATSGLDDLKKTLHDSGYTAMMIGEDKTRPEIIREIMFNNNDGSIAFVSLVRDGTGEDATVKKICLEYVSDHMMGDGPSFKKFILNQHIWERMQAENEGVKAEKERLEKEHDPYGGDNFHA